MAQNRKFALIFRLSALLLAIAGVAAQMGVFKGSVSFAGFMYYTIQSNLLVIFMFVLLVIKTAKSLRESATGFAGWYPRFEMICTVNVFVTFIVFWALLTPTVSADYLRSFENLAIHAITPILCLADYLLFTKSPHLKYRDVYYTLIFPLSYVIFVTIAGFAGYVFYYVSELENPLSSYMDMVPVRFPYFFLDFDRIGYYVFAFVAGIAVFILLLGHVAFAIDRKLRKR
ncbi:MAG: Pr6Pr family membrane protein [Oscillospiraceae bacterium]|nr:Pr6Pr family membrane protein [Oscillospiraceae bacterium]